MTGFGGKVLCIQQITKEFHTGSLHIFWLSTLLFSSKSIVCSTLCPSVSALYRQFHPSFHTASYLNQGPPYLRAQALRFCCSNHRLDIELGRHSHTPSHNGPVGSVIPEALATNTMRSNAPSFWTSKSTKVST